MTHPRSSRSKLATRRELMRGDEGAALVEFALVAPFFFLVIFGIIEFGWAFGQHLDTRHAAREGSRLVAVNYNPEDETDGDLQRADIVSDTCDRMDIGNGATTIDLQFVTSGETERGDFAEVTVSTELETITGFLDFALADVDLESTVQTRLEQDASWTATTTAGGDPCP